MSDQPGAAVRETEFRQWLQSGAPLAEASCNTRVAVVKTIERKLKELGSTCTTLEEAWAHDRFAGLQARLREIQQDSRAGGLAFRTVMPESANPHNRLTNWRNWLGQYGRFLNGEKRTGAKDADHIRQHVLENYIESAREAGQAYVEVLVSDVNKALGLNQAWPNICQALAGKIFLDMAQVPPPERIGADQSSATVFRFSVSIQPLTDAELLALFDANRPNFKAARGHWDAETTRRFCRFARIIHDAGLDWWHVNIPPYQIRFGRDEPGRKQAISVLGSVEQQSPIIWFKKGALESFSGATALADGECNEFLNTVEAASEILRAWRPPGFDRPGYWPNQLPAEAADPTPLPRTKTNMSDIESTNLILYGPPGTGKTFATAAKAVELCGEPVPADRDDLMDAYRRLSVAGRIEFVTFHQSMAYENFVEGKQPVTGQNEEEAASGGFHLETVPGVFRRIARRAETSRGRAAGADAITIGQRQVFKTSIGEAANPEDAHLFEEAIAGGYTLLGFEDIDWSDDKYTEREAIITACREQGEREGELNAQTARIQMPFIFRNWVKPGDIVVVSKGNGLFRAIGEFTGGYEFHPRSGGGYAHRRAVRWLWVDRDGVPVSEIYQRRFSMRTIYLLEKQELNVPALERYMNSQQPQAAAEPEPFVLIIDEINRANISKVFGELITLLEPDKRLGKCNELKVRLPYSEDEFGVPANLHIIGTMNTADRSIALLDTALRRRFDFEELMPDPLVLATAAELSKIDLPRLLTIINERIEYLFDREHQIGHAYFVNCHSRRAVDDVMRHKVIPLLAEYFYEDWSKVAAVLGDAETHEREIEGGFLRRAVLKAPPGIESDADAPVRFRWSVRREEEGFDYTRLLVA